MTRIDWLSRISNDITLVDQFLVHFNAEYDEAKKEIISKGNLERLLANLSSDFEKRYSQLQEIEAVLRYLELEIKKEKGNLFKTLFEGRARKLEYREIEKYVDADDNILLLNKILNEVAFVRNKFLSITSAFEKQQWMLTNITKLRVAGLDQVEIW